MYVTNGPVCSGQLVASMTPNNSLYRLRKTVTTPKATLVTTDFSCILQFIEGTRVANLGFGTSTAVQLVARIGIKGPAGTYSFVLRNGPIDRSFVRNFTISASEANTDIVRTFVIPGDTTGVWPQSAVLGMSYGIFDAVGPTYQGVEGWQAGDIRGTAANSNLVATNGNVVELFDAGLYPDPQNTGVAPIFVAPDYAEELTKCRRYWWCSNPVSPKGVGAGALSGYTINTTAIGYSTWRFTVPMRIAPAPANISLWYNGNQNQVRNTNSGAAIAVGTVATSYLTAEGGSLISMGTATTASVWIDFDMQINVRM